MKIFSITIILSFVSFFCLFSQKSVIYKQIDTTCLYMKVYSPQNLNAEKTLPAMIFFFGGGWAGGSVKQFEPQAEYFIQRGVVCFLVDYRVANRHKTTPFESVKDAKSAIRFIRENASKFHINPSKIIAAGGSAGGQLAAATALIDKYNENTDNLSISCVPNALVLYNPAIDNGPNGCGYNLVKTDFQNFSPIHNIRKGMPPTVFFLGTNDNLIPVETANKFKNEMEKVGSRCDLHLYEGQKHGFFNFNNTEYFEKTVAETDLFLQSLDFIFP